MIAAGRVRVLLAVTVVLLLAVIALSRLPGVAARIGQGALLVAMAAAVAFMAAAE